MNTEYDLDSKNATTSLDSWLLEMLGQVKKALKKAGVHGKFQKLSLGEQLAQSAMITYRKSIEALGHSMDGGTASVHNIDDSDSIRADFFMHISGFVLSALPEYLDEMGLSPIDVSMEPICFIIRQSTFDAVNDTKDLDESFCDLVKDDEFLQADNFTLFIDLMGVDCSDIMPSVLYDGVQNINAPRGILINHGVNSRANHCTFTIVNSSGDKDVSLALNCWIEGDDRHEHYRKIEQLTKKLLIVVRCEPSTRVPKIPKGVLGTKKPRSGLLKKNSKGFSIFSQKILTPRLGKNYGEGKGSGGSNKKTDRWWLVTGFWRMQAFGPRLLNRRKRIWIAPHYRGNRDGVKINELIIK